MSLAEEIHACAVCAAHLPLGPRPIVQFSPTSKLLIIGQAPGSKVHHSGIPWNDQSGDLLRKWLQLDKASFYNPEKVALMPMGFCYPGSGKSGDLPPRTECAPHWHQLILQQFESIALTLFIGQYSQAYYLKEKARPSLTETVAAFREYLPDRLPLPHPSPRNRIWMKKNPWFEQDLLPVLQKRMQELGL